MIPVELEIEGKDLFYMGSNPRKKTSDLTIYLKKIYSK